VTTLQPRIPQQGDGQIENTTEEFQIMSTTSFWLGCLIAKFVYTET
jgi:hypothetical protein